MAEAICGRIAVPEQRDIEAEELKRVNEELKGAKTSAITPNGCGGPTTTIPGQPADYAPFEEIERRSKQKRRG